MAFRLFQYSEDTLARYYAGKGGSQFATNYGIQYGGSSYPLYGPSARVQANSPFASSRFTRVNQGGPLNGYPVDSSTGGGYSGYSANAILKQKFTEMVSGPSQLSKFNARYGGTPLTPSSPLGNDTAIGRAAQRGLFGANGNAPFSPVSFSQQPSPLTPRTPVYRQQQLFNLPGTVGPAQLSGNPTAQFPTVPGPFRGQLPITNAANQRVGLQGNLFARNYGFDPARGQSTAGGGGGGFTGGGGTYGSGGGGRTPFTPSQGGTPQGNPLLRGLSGAGALLYTAASVFNQGTDAVFGQVAVGGTYAYNLFKGFNNAQAALPASYVKSPPIPVIGGDGAQLLNKKGNPIFRNAYTALDAAGNPASTSPTFLGRLGGAARSVSESGIFTKLLYADAAAGAAQGLFGSTAYSREAGFRKTAGIGLGLVSSRIGALAGGGLGARVGGLFGPEAILIGAGVGSALGGAVGFLGGPAAVSVIPGGRDAINSYVEEQKLGQLRANVNAVYQQAGSYSFNTQEASPLGRAVQGAGQFVSTVGDFILGASNPILVSVRNASGTDPFAIREKQQKFYNDLSNRAFNRIDPLAAGIRSGSTIAQNSEDIVRGGRVEQFNKEFRTAQYIGFQSAGYKAGDKARYNVGATAPLATEYTYRKAAEQVTRRDIARQSTGLNEFIGAVGNIFGQIGESYRAASEAQAGVFSRPYNPNLFNEQSKRNFVQNQVQRDLAKNEALRPGKGILADIVQSLPKGLGGEGKNIFTAQYLSGSNLRFQKSVTSFVKDQINFFSKGFNFGAVDRQVANLGKVPTFQQLISSSSKGLAKIASQSVGTQRGGYGGGYSAYRAQIEAEQTRRAKLGYDDAVFRRDLNKVDYPTYLKPEFDYRQYSSETPISGLFTPEEFRQQRGQSYDKQLDAYKVQNDALDKLDAEFTKTYTKRVEKRVADLTRDLKKAPSAKEQYGIKERIEELKTQADSTIREVVTRPQKLRNLQYQRYAADRGASIEQDLSAERGRVLSALPRDIRYLNSGTAQLKIQGLDTQRYQLNQNQQLGLVSRERFIVEDYGLERSRIGIQKQDAKDDLAYQRQNLELERLNAESETDPVRRQRYLNLINQKQSALNQREAALNNNFTELESAFSPQTANRLAEQQRSKTIGTAVGPYIKQFFGGAFSGAGLTAAAAGAGKLAAGDVGDFLQGQAGDLLAKLSKKFVPLGTNVRNPADLIGGFFNKRYGGAPTPTYGLKAGQLVKTGTKYLNPTGRFAGLVQNPGAISAGLGGIAAGTAAANYLYPALFPDKYYNRGAGSFSSAALGGAGALLGSLIPGVGTFAGGAIGSTLGGAFGILGGQSQLGGAASGALGGALGGFAIGNLIAPGIGGLIGGGLGLLGGAISGFFGGKSKAQIEQERRAKELERQRQIEFGKNFAKSQYSLGNEKAGDLFDGYGNFDTDLSNLKSYIGSDRLNSILKANDFSFGGKDNKDARNAFKSEFSRLGGLFSPVISIAERERQTLSRPGGLEGAIYDTTLDRQRTVGSYSPFVSGPVTDLYNNFQSLQSDLAKYGVDSDRALKAQGVFQQQYENQKLQLDYQISQGDRDFGFLVRGNELNRIQRGIQGDQINRQVANFDRDSQNQIEAALGTLQRRENRSAIVARLKDDQSFDKDILLRQQDLFNKSSVLSTQQEYANQSDAARELGQLQDSRTILVDNFAKLQPLVGSTADDFLRLSEVVKEVNRALEDLNRNLR